jgi:hypothetical protein
MSARERVPWCSCFDTRACASVMWAILARERVRNGRIYLHTMKNCKPIFLPLPPAVINFLTGLPEPKGTTGQSKYSFCSGNGTTRALIRGVT